MHAYNTIHSSIILAFLSALHSLSLSFQKKNAIKVFTWKTSTQFKKSKMIKTFISSDEIRRQQLSMSFIWHCLQTYLEKLILDLITFVKINYHRKMEWCAHADLNNFPLNIGIDTSFNLFNIIYNYN